jgi:hypothetical protein
MSRLDSLLENLEATLASVESHENEDFASQVLTSSLRGNRDQLRKDMQKPEILEWEEDPIPEVANDIEVVLRGDPVQGHSILAQFFGKFLDNLQALTNAVGQLQFAQSTDRGRVQRSVLGSNRLLVSSVFEGSFGINLSVASDKPEMFEQSRSTLAAIHTLLDGDVNNDILVENLVHPRVKAHYKKLVDLVASGGASVDFRTASEPNPVSMSPSQARVRLEWLENLQTITDSVDAVGVFKGGDVDKKNFSIRDDDGTSYSGRVSPNAEKKLNGLALNQRVRARIDVYTQLHDDLSTETVVHLLQDIDPEIIRL